MAVGDPGYFKQNEVMVMVLSVAFKAYESRLLEPRMLADEKHWFNYSRSLLRNLFIYFCCRHVIKFL